jgi:hypothetical protein
MASFRIHLTLDDEQAEALREAERDAATNRTVSVDRG